MPNYNKCIIAGNIASDLELKGDKTSVMNFSVAVNQKWTDYKTKKEHEKTTFIPITAFGKQAEIIEQYCKKGDPILIEGEFNTDSWEDKKTGEKKYKSFVKLIKFEFLTSHGGGGGGGGGGSRRRDDDDDDRGGRGDRRDDRSRGSRDDDRGGRSRRRDDDDERPARGKRRDDDDDDSIPY